MNEGPVCITLSPQSPARSPACARWQDGFDRYSQCLAVHGVQSRYGVSAPASRCLTSVSEMAAMNGLSTEAARVATISVMPP